MKNLKEHNKRCLLAKRDVSKTPLASVVQAIIDCKYDNDRSADEEAIKFYLLNHLMGILRVNRGDHEILTEKEQSLVELYFKTGNESAIRMFYYVLLICTRESRHVGNGPTFTKGLEKKFGKQIYNFNDSIAHVGSSMAIDVFKKHPPKVTIGHYCDCLVHIFYKGSFSGGFGGEKWGAVAKVLRDFVYGVIPAEIMVDNAFNLSHNNGPIFNKGMLYNGYSSQFIKILDIQRSGQIPLFMLYEDNENTGNSRITPIMKLGIDLFPHIFEGYVDWYLVERDGVAMYHSQKMTQKEKHGEPEWQKIASEASLKIVKKAQLKKAEEKKHQFIIGKHVYQKIYLNREAV